MVMRGVQYEDSFGIAQVETLVGPCCCRTGIRVPTFGSTRAFQMNMSHLSPCMRRYDHPRASNGHFANTWHVAGDSIQPCIELSSQLAFGIAVPTTSMLGLSDIHAANCNSRSNGPTPFETGSTSVRVLVGGHTIIPSSSELPLRGDGGARQMWLSVRQ